MRPRFLLCSLLLAFALLAVLFLFRPAEPTTAPYSPQEVVEKSKPSTAPISAPQSKVGPTPASSRPLTGARIDSSGGKSEKLVQDFNEAHYHSIDFYGLVVDQDSNPVPNVKINVTILQQQISPPTATGDFPLTNSLIHREKETGADGRFQITGEMGQDLTIESIQKSGYEVEPDFCPHTFAASNGWFRDPMTFKMWNTNIHEQLIIGEKKFQIVPDGKPYYIDLVGGTITQTESGNLKVWVKYPEQAERGQIYDWSCFVEVVNGGLQPGDSYSMFSAPANGYVSDFSLQQKIRGGQSGTIGDRRFYITLNNGSIFGRMQIDLIAPFNAGIPGMIRLSYAINPSGSRILR